MDGAEIWERLMEMVEGGAFSGHEVPLPLLGNLLWPESDSNELKFLNRILAQVLRQNGVRIVKKHGIRYAKFY